MNLIKWPVSGFALRGTEKTHFWPLQSMHDDGAGSRLKSNYHETTAPVWKHTKSISSKWSLCARTAVHEISAAVFTPARANLTKGGKQSAVLFNWAEHGKCESTQRTCFLKRIKTNVKVKMIVWKVPRLLLLLRQLEHSSSADNLMSKQLKLEFGKTITRIQTWCGTKSALNWATNVKRPHFDYKIYIRMDPTLTRKRSTLLSTSSMAKWLHASCHTPSQTLQWGQDLLGVISGITPATRTHTRCPRNGCKSSTALHLVYSDRLACWIFFFLFCFGWGFFFLPRIQIYELQPIMLWSMVRIRGLFFRAVRKQQHMSVSWCIL